MFLGRVKGPKYGRGFKREGGLRCYKGVVIINQDIGFSVFGFINTPKSHKNKLNIFII